MLHSLNDPIRPSSKRHASNEPTTRWGMARHLVTWASEGCYSKLREVGFGASPLS